MVVAFASWCSGGLPYTYNIMCRPKKMWRRLAPISLKFHTHLRTGTRSKFPKESMCRNRMDHEDMRSWRSKIMWCRPKKMWRRLAPISLKFHTHLRTGTRSKFPKESMCLNIMVQELWGIEVQKFKYSNQPISIKQRRLSPILLKFSQKNPCRTLSKCSVAPCDET